MAITWLGKMVLIVVVAAIFMVFVEGVVEESSSSWRDLESKNHLRRLNKPPVKTIKSKDGDIIDCIDIHRQPAFKHPLLKNHRIQMRPTTYPRGNGQRVSRAPPQSAWQKSGTCPKGTVPIRRTRKRDKIRAVSFQSPGRRYPTASSDNSYGHENALIYTKDDVFLGAKAQINAWNIHVEPNEFSASKITILSSDGPDASSIQVGWIVHPLLFGDDKTRLFTYWTGDGFNRTGCFNVLCPGFVQVSKNVVLGADITPLSTYNGTQYIIDLMVYKDPKNGNWWLVYGNEPVGYWPTPLFKNLKEATLIEWGGEVLNTAMGGIHTTTQMGSGHFPYEGPGKSSYFRNILTVDQTNIFRAPDWVVPFSDKPQCYNVRYDGSKIGKDMGYFFFFGGPGEGADCP
ncbi:protein neprosin-like [Magnolia sinica]|uniref:protein neprosin-like n=1 Tax=Magnolia sinica TaxID=86752 RepID=UPI002658C348|nr:protein neprosin-like [Magnolia sinica]XP_058073992.1 protein neprosin-like [Magnolia sinica]